MCLLLLTWALSRGRRIWAVEQEASDGRLDKLSWEVDTPDRRDEFRLFPRTIIL